MVALHTGRTVPWGHFTITVMELQRLLSGVTVPEISAGHELARLVGDYLAQGRTGPVLEREAREALPFGFATVAATAIMVKGTLHSVTMDILAASLANPTETSYDVLDPITGALVQHRDLI